MRILISIIFILFTLSSYAQKNTCAEFKMGDFKYANPAYSDWKIIRSDAIQIEINTKTNVEIYSSIVWESDCNYVLTCYKVLNLDSKTQIGKIFRINIVKTFPKRYICISKNDAIEDMELEMIKVE